MTLAAVAACGSTPSSEPATAAKGPINAIQATLGAIASGAEGSARIQRRDPGVALLVQLAGLNPGPYRVAIHTTGNCTSPNGFSAGPVWDIPGLGPQVFEVMASSNGNVILTKRLGAIALEGPQGLMGRSVVVHAGDRGGLDARPGVPNDRVACGTLGPVQSLF